jgi:hypothetical protein
MSEMTTIDFDLDFLRDDAGFGHPQVNSKTALRVTFP